MLGRDEDFDQGRARLTRRAFFVIGLQAAGLVTLGARAKYLQIDQNERFAVMAEDNRIKTVLEPAPRGIIYDNSGRKIAENVPNFLIEFDPDQREEAEATLRALQELLSLDEELIARKLVEIENQRHNLIPIADQVSWQEFSLINENLPALTGLRTRVALSRIYPYHEIFAHQVGYVAKFRERNKDQLDFVHPIYFTPDMVIGQLGVESHWEQSLRGVEAKLIYEQNAFGNIIREVDEKTPVPGDDVQVTLDTAFQHYAMERMKEESAAAVVIDIETGDVKLMASTPSYDPNLFVHGISQTDYDSLLNNQYRPLTHKAIQGAYPPGSTFKMVTALAALEQGVMLPNETIHCSGSINRGRDFNCWKASGHGRMNLRNSLKESCDVYYYTIGERASIDNIASMARRLGLGERYELPQSGIHAGHIPTREWKKERFDQDWYPGDTLNASIGQGYVLATPMQLAVMTARIASNKAVTPNLIASVNGVPNRLQFDDLGLNDEHLRHVRDGMFDVVNGSNGTAGRSKIQGDYLMAGKTGTSQVRNISKAERERGVVRNDQLPWERRDHALFVAYAPADNPKYAISVVVEHGGGGSTAAAPIAQDLMLYALYGGRPPLSAYPAASRDRAAQFMTSVPPLETIIRTEENREQAANRRNASTPESDDA